MNFSTERKIKTYPLCKNQEEFEEIKYFSLKIIEKALEEEEVDPNIALQISNLIHQEQAFPRKTKEKFSKIMANYAREEMKEILKKSDSLLLLDLEKLDFYNLSHYLYCVHN